eukprot:TRINITY_DN7341_c1_g1_i1.p2 TRINITY_DN7341_c1_g1~~TRINITY_DN7341_c1_g1_i1.p2  ORF type:complete len:125 (-),score=5.56 TRINITY_DN7341_c1_g1_i1:33-407(-)
MAKRATEQPLTQCDSCEATLDSVQRMLGRVMPPVGEPVLPGLMLCADLARAMGYVGAGAGVFAGIPLAHIHYGIRVSRRRYLWSSLLSGIGFGTVFYAYNVVFHRACHPTNRKASGSGWYSSAE